MFWSSLEYENRNKWREAKTHKKFIISEGGGQNITYLDRGRPGHPLESVATGPRKSQR